MLSVILRGIRHRLGQSIIVVTLAAVAVAAAVLTPAYTQAAQQSLLTDTLRSSADQLGLRATSAMPRMGETDELVEGRLTPGTPDYADRPGYLDAQLTADSRLDPLTPPVEFVAADVAVSGGEYPAAAQALYRSGVCVHVTVVDGDCETDEGEVLLSQRSARAQGVEAGDVLSLTPAESDHADEAEYVVAGVYTVHDAESGYWGPGTPVRHGPDSEGEEHLDALVATQPAALKAVGLDAVAGVDYRLDADELDVAGAQELVDGVAALEALEHLPDPQESSRTISLHVNTSLPAVISAAGDEHDAAAESIPLVAIPLVVLCWFVLYQAVARQTEDRGQELALAKLRGHPPGSLIAFGLGGVTALSVLAAPIGVLLGLGIVEAVARWSLADTAGAMPSLEVAAYGATALVGAALAAVLAVRRTLRQSAPALSRRVPTRRRSRIGWAEGAAAALTGVVLYVILTDSEAGALGMLATPLLAVVAGMAAARLLAFYAGTAAPRALRRGNLERGLALAQLERRPELTRVMVLVAVAAALLTFGAAAWDVADHNRRVAADDAFAAATVYRVAAMNPHQFGEAVTQVDPDGEHSLAAVRSFERYDSQNVTVVAMQTDRLESVVDWRGHDAPQKADVAAALRPKSVAPLQVHDELRVEAVVDEMDSDSPLRLAAKLDGGDAGPQTVQLGDLEAGSATYSADVPECAHPCRLIGLGVSRAPADFEPVEFSLRVDAVSDAGSELSAGLDDSDAWRTAVDVPDTAALEVAGEPEGLRLEGQSDDPRDLIAEHAVTPEALPVVLAGESLSDEREATQFAFPAPHGELQDYEVAHTATVVPRGGPRALLVDLDYTVDVASAFEPMQRQPGVSFEVWASEAAPADLADQLREQGIVITAVEERADFLDQLTRTAPALALRLYLLAGAAALALAAGAVIMSTRAGGRSREHDYAALRLAGVPRARLRAALRREHVAWIGAAGAAGVCAGLLGVVLLLPRVPLLSSQAPAAPVEYQLGAGWLPAAIGVMGVVLAVAAAAGVRSQLRSSDPNRLREGD